MKFCPLRENFVYTDDLVPTTTAAFAETFRIYTNYIGLVQERC